MADYLEDDPYKYFKQRESLPADDPLQQILAPLEHRQFTQEFVRNNPILGAPAMFLGAPAYAALKLIPGVRQRLGATPPSLDQIFAAWQGIKPGFLEGLQNRK